MGQRVAGAQAGLEKWKDYQVLGELDFAKQAGDRGLVFWAESSLVDNAVGLDNDLWWDWAARASIRRNPPPDVL